METEEKANLGEIPTKKKRERRLHPIDIENLFNLFKRDLSYRAYKTLIEAKYDGTENEINLLLAIWFDEYLNRGGTMLKMPSIFLGNTQIKT